MASTKAADHIMDLLFVDIGEASSVSSHDRRLDKLKELGAAGSLLCWDGEFPTKRSSSARVNQSTFHCCPVRSDLPLGSTLVPLVFFVNVKDSSSVFQFNSLISAENVKMRTTIHRLVNFEILQGNLANFEQWMAKRGMPLNFAKCKHAYLAPCHRVQP